MENKKELQAALQEFRLPRWNEIPDVGLYLDQVVKYINTYFESFPEMKVTASMVSNYVKKKLIMNPHRKTYSREQIAQLIFIAAAKTVLSMDNIRVCFDIQKEHFSTEKSYNVFCDTMESVLSTFSSDDQNLLNKDARSDEEEILRNIVITIAHKMYLERYFQLTKAAEE